MKSNFFQSLLLPAIAALGLSTSPAMGQATVANGDLVLGFRASGGVGSSRNYVVNLGPASALLSATTAQILPLTGVGTDVSSGSLYGASWHTRSDVFWGVAGAVGNFAPIGSEVVGTLYATRAQTANGTTAAAWQRRFAGSHSTTTTRIQSMQSGFNNATLATAASAIARTNETNLANSWSSFQPGVAVISFDTFNPSIEGNPSQYLDLFRVVPLASTDPVSPSSHVGRLVLRGDASLLFVPAAAIGIDSVQLSAATYSAAEDNTAGVLTVTVTRTGDTSGATTVTLSTADGTALAGTDYTALSAQSVAFAANELSKTVDIPVTNRPGDQGSRSFTVTLGGAAGGTSIGTLGSATCTITEAPSVFQLSAPLYSTSQSAGTVNVTVTRSSGSAAASVQISTADGTAVASTHYTAISNQVVNFPASTTSVQVPVTILPSGVTNVRQFTVTLSNPSAGSSLDPDQELITSTVRIAPPDAIAPTLTITNPAANAAIAGSLNGVIVASGTASDNVGIATVEASFDGITWVNANLTGSNWSTASSGSNALRPAGGPTTLRVRATDLAGNVTTRTVNFSYNISLAASALSVNIVNASGTGGSVTGLLTGTASYIVGRTYTLTAVPGANQAFDGWTVPGLSGFTTELPRLSFVFTQAIAASPVITARFVSNPFAANANVAGSFQGIIEANSTTEASNATYGCINLTVTAGTGAFTGNVKIDGGSLTILAGVFDNTGVANFGPTRTATAQIVRQGKAPYVLAMQLDFANKVITGSLNEAARGGFSTESAFVARRAAYSRTAPVEVPDLLNVGTGSAARGVYTAVLPARSGATVSIAGVAFTSSEFPQGDGFSTINLRSDGSVAFAGTLADGTRFTAAGRLSSDKKAVLYAPLYRTGSVGGEVTFSVTAGDAFVNATDVFWFRPYQAGHYYPFGWPDGIYTDLVGSEYNVVSGTAALAGLSAVSPAGNAQLIANDGLLSNSVTKNLNIAPTNAVTRLGTPADPSYSLVVTSASGLISGDFTHTGTTRVRYSGIILQKGANAGGYGHFLSPLPKVVTGAGEAGGISLAPR